jgi:hypothetical protein
VVGGSLDRSKSSVVIRGQVQLPSKACSLVLVSVVLFRTTRLAYRAYAFFVGAIASSPLRGTPAPLCIRWKVRLSFPIGRCFSGVSFSSRTAECCLFPFRFAWSISTQFGKASLFVISRTEQFCQSDARDQER